MLKLPISPFVNIKNSTMKYIGAENTAKEQLCIYIPTFAGRYTGLCKFSNYLQSKRYCGNT